MRKTTLWSQPPLPPLCVFQGLSLGHQVCTANMALAEPYCWSVTASFKVRVLLSVTVSGTLITILLYPLPPKVLIMIPAKCSSLKRKSNIASKSQKKKKKKFGAGHCCCLSPGCSSLLSKLLVTLAGAAFLQFSSGHFRF